MITKVKLKNGYNVGLVKDLTAAEIERVDVVRKIIMKTPKRLNMDWWHPIGWDQKQHSVKEEITCKSAHCFAGWLHAMTSSKAIRSMYPSEAAKKLVPALQREVFSWGKRKMMHWLKTREYAKKHRYT